MKVRNFITLQDELVHAYTLTASDSTLPKESNVAFLRRRQSEHDALKKRPGTVRALGVCYRSQDQLPDNVFYWEKANQFGILI